MSFFEEATSKMNKKSAPKVEEKETGFMASPAPHPSRDILQAFSMVKVESDLKMKIQIEIESLQTFSEEFDIVDQETLDRSAEMILQSNKINNTIEAYRKKAVRPFLDIQQEINGFTKPYINICQNIKEGLAKKRSVYQKEQHELEMKRQRVEAERVLQEEKRAREEEERKRREEFTKRSKSLREDGILPPPTPPVVTPTPPPLPIPTVQERFSTPTTPKKFSDGRVDTKLVVVFEVENFDIIPHKFLALDESAVKRSLDAGVREIPGLIIKEEMKEIFRAGRR